MQPRKRTAERKKNYRLYQFLRIDQKKKNTKGFDNNILAKKTKKARKSFMKKKIL